MKTSEPVMEQTELQWAEQRRRMGMDTPEFGFNGVSRREFVQVLGAGLLVSVVADDVDAQQRRGGGGGRGGGGPRNVTARLHIGEDNVITVMTGKVECGNGARAELSQAAAEELRVPMDRIRLIMADTGQVPDDGITAGSRSTPSTVPSIRAGAATALMLLKQAAAKRWGASVEALKVEEGKIAGPEGKSITYGELAKSEEVKTAFAQPMQGEVSVMPVAEWVVMGTSVPRPNALDLVTGKHHFPSDIMREGMVYGAVLRAPSYGAKLESLEESAVAEMKDVKLVRDGEFVGVVAKNKFLANQAIEALAEKAKWTTAPHPSSRELFEHLRRRVQGGMPKNPFAEEVAQAPAKLKQSYHVAYVQHAPMEPRAAVAEWSGDGKLTVWTATQNPFGVRGELQRAFQLADDKVRVIVPDFGGGFGGKHSGECAVEAARLAKGAAKPVSLRWSRAEEFTWAYFRPAALIDAEATLDDAGKIATWHFVNVNSGGSAVETPYAVPKNRSQFVASSPPLRHGSYRALASTANVFARESFMDELAVLAKKDQHQFRRSHLENERLRNVLDAAAKKFGWGERVEKKEANAGIGIACGTEKGSFVAACAEVSVNPETREITIRRIVQAYECGKIINPDNLMQQGVGSIIMGLGPALSEEMIFEEGKMLNASFRKYPVPRFRDVPVIEVELLDRPDLPSVGGSETPIIAVAPAIANAVFAATGVRVRQMPIRLPNARRPAEVGGAE